MRELTVGDLGRELWYTDPKSLQESKMNIASRWKLVAFVVAVAASFLMSGRAKAQACRPDLNGDERVDGADLGILLGAWGFCPPGIESVSPSHGGTQGGTVISITGSGMSSVTAVRIGGVPCTGVTVLSPTLVRATTPPGAVGEASISITSPGGTALAPVPFTYVLQQVTSVVPSSGPYVGGTPITINGQFLSGATAVTVGGVPCTNVVSVSSTQVTAVTPAGSVGTSSVVVVCQKGTVTVEGAFTYLPFVVPAWATLVEANPDPSVVTDIATRAAIVASGRPWRVRDTATQIEMVLIPPGTFQMGCTPSIQTPCNSIENPSRAVTLTNAFYLGRYEVTQAQWEARMGSNPSQFSGATRPVERVTWNTIQGFLSATGMRLPTEAEWEYSCRAGTATALYNSSNDEATVTVLGWFLSNSANQTQPVGHRQQNQFGLFDMMGNVQEWVADWFASYPASAQTNPSGPSTGSGRVLRGGDWSWGAARSSTRNSEAPANAGSNVGFRVARNP
jgi:formylglycine-generating enzyme required for sulfatase activity